MSKSALFYKVQLALQHGLFTHSHINLFIADTLIYNYDDYAINCNTPRLKYCVFIMIDDKNNNCLIPNLLILTFEVTQNLYLVIKNFDVITKNNVLFPIGQRITQVLLGCKSKNTCFLKVH